MSSGDDLEMPQSGNGKKRYHRHTPQQIQELEAMFKMYPHPDEKQRMQLSRDLGLEPRQIKFWFQNRRTQMKAQTERSDNSTLRAENDRIRCENILMHEALKRAYCPGCGSPPPNEDAYLEEQKLRIENARLKEELDRVSTLASKYLGRPITQLPPLQSLQLSSLDLSVGGAFSSQGLSPSLDLDLLSGSSLSAMPPFPLPTAVSELDKPIMAQMATTAMEELIRLVQTNEPLWVKSGRDNREILHLETYEMVFSGPVQKIRSPDTRVETSRDSALVMMNTLALVDKFMDVSKWVELFPTIVSNARIVEVLATGMGESLSGCLVLMHEELQILSTVVPTREFYFLRYCRQIEPGLWAIADVSVEFPGENQPTSTRTRKLPSGCLIKDVSNGYSKITWVEHIEIEDRNPTHQLYRELMESGMAFGAQRWLAVLQRMCERFACLRVTELPTRNLGGVVPPHDAKRGMMKLAQRMVKDFCSSITSSNGQRWATLSALSDVGVQVAVHNAVEAGMVLRATTTLWLPVSPQRVFSFFRDERTRAQWDVHSNGNAVQEIVHVTNGSHPGNCISLLRALNLGQSDTLILQEFCTDSSGTLVVYAPVDLSAVNAMMISADTSYVRVIPSGFSILPDGREGASTSSNPRAGSAGSLITVALQLLTSNLPSAKVDADSLTMVNNLISAIAQQLKVAFSYPNI